MLLLDDLLINHVVLKAVEVFLDALGVYLIESGPDVVVTWDDAIHFVLLLDLDLIEVLKLGLEWYLLGDLHELVCILKFVVHFFERLIIHVGQLLVLIQMQYFFYVRFDVFVDDLTDHFDVSELRDIDPITVLRLDVEVLLLAIIHIFLV